MMSGNYANAGRVVFAAALLVTSSCGKTTLPTIALGECRTYPRTIILVESATELPCAVEGTAPNILRCGVFGNIFEWMYPTRGDFIDEALVPGRFRMTQMERRVSGFGSGGIARWQWSYDPSGRAVDRVVTRVPNNVTVPPFVSSRAVFSTWDSRGRPTAGIDTAGAGAGPFTIDYDDGARASTWSTGEISRQDEHGNFLSFGGYEFTVMGTQQVCR